MVAFIERILLTALYGTVPPSPDHPAPLTRKRDYPQLGGRETGLDVLLRCLEVLSTSEASSLGPASPSPAVLAAPPGTTDPSADATGVGAGPMAAAEAAGEVGGASAVRESEKQEQEKKRRKVGGQEGGGPAGEGDESKARRIGDGEAVTATATSTTATPAFLRRRRRGSVVGGLVAALVPWEHSRRIQRAALLVLGNVLGNALEEDSEEGVGEEARCPSEYCAVELRKSLVSWDAGGEGEWGGGGKEEGGEEAAGAERSGTPSFGAVL